MERNLMQLNIQRAQEEIDRKKELVSKGSMRQEYHFMPQAGWMNDPNGLICFRGKYHFFYQCNPYGAFWDCMYWGHAVSEDLIHWEYLPLALAPSESYDDYPKGGCFSGSAIVCEDKLFLMYTGTANNGNGVEQTQCIAYSTDGIHFEKYGGNPVLRAPKGIQRYGNTVTRTIWCAVQVGITKVLPCFTDQKTCFTGHFLMYLQKVEESGDLCGNARTFFRQEISMF